MQGEGIDPSRAGLGQAQGLAGWTALPYLRLLDHQYLQWNAAIASHFLKMGNPNRRVLFYVDEDSIREIGPKLPGNSRNALDDFVAAVRRTLNGNTIFSLHTQLLLRWQDQIGSHQIVEDSPPPFLGLLALFVLAAGDMQRDSRIGVNTANYYIRLRTLLNITPTNGGQPQAFDDHSKRAWPLLEQWLETTNQGKFGVIPDRPNPRIPYVSRPMNQCVLRAGDRSKLTEFVAWAGWSHPGELPTKSELIFLLRGWASQTGHLSAHGTAQLEDDDAAKVIAEIVFDDFAYLAISGNQTPTAATSDRAGPRPGKIVLQFIPKRNGTGSWAFQPKACNVSDVTVARGPDGEVSLKPMNEHWLEPLYGLQVKTYLEGQRSLVLQTEMVTFRWWYEEIHVLAFGDGNNGAKGEISQIRPEFGVPCSILFRDSSSRSVMDVLDHCTDGNFTKRPASMAPSEGWSLVSNVVFERAYDGRDYPPECLVPERPRGGIALKGGIKLGADEWFEGYPPRALVTPDMGELRSLWVNTHQVPEEGLSGLVDLVPYLHGGLNTLKTDTNLSLIKIRIREYESECPVIEPSLAFQFLYENNQANLRDGVLHRVHREPERASGPPLIHVSGARITWPAGRAIAPVPITEDVTPRPKAPPRVRGLRGRRTSATFTFPEQFRSLIVVGNLPGEIMRVLAEQITGHINPSDERRVAVAGMTLTLPFTPQFSWNGQHVERIAETIEKPVPQDEFWLRPHQNYVHSWAKACENIPHAMWALFPEMAKKYRDAALQIIHKSRAGSHP